MAHLSFRQHTNLKPHKCTICSAGFKSEIGLVSHREYIHGIVDDPQERCHLCGVDYFSKLDSKIHLINEHGLDERWSDSEEKRKKIEQTEENRIQRGYLRLKELNDYRWVGDRSRLFLIPCA